MLFCKLSRTTFYFCVCVLDESITRQHPIGAVHSCLHFDCLIHRKFPDVPLQSSIYKELYTQVFTCGKGDCQDSICFIILILINTYTSTRLYLYIRKNSDQYILRQHFTINIVLLARVGAGHSHFSALFILHQLHQGDD